MNHIVSLSLIALILGIANGGVVRDDSMVDMLQGMLMNPEAAASALGMTRNKRSAWDKEFNLEKMGFSFKIKYQDPSNRLQGGKAEVAFEDVRKFVRRVPVKSAKFVVDFDSQGNQRDGLFSLKVDYELGFLFGGQDSGKLSFIRNKNGAFYSTNVEFLSNSANNPDRPPTVQLVLKSDYKTKAEMKALFDKHDGQPKEYNANMEFINKDTFKGKFVGDKVYNFEGHYNAAEKKFDVEVELDGKKYNGMADVDFDGQQATFKINMDLGAAGKVNFEFNGQKDFSSAGFKVFFNDKDIFSAKLKGKMDMAPKKFMYELRFSGVMVGDGKLRMSYERFKEIKFQYLPQTGMTFEYITEMDENKNLNQRVTAEYNGEKEFEVVSSLAPRNDATTVGFNSKVNWFIRDMSPFYKFFYRMNCMYCLNPFRLESNLAMDKNKLYSFEFDVTDIEDGSSHKEVYITTKDRYYAMFSENFINEMYHLVGSFRRADKDFEVEAEYNPGKFLKVTANRPWFQTFMIENMDGYMRKVEFNGKELLKAGFGKNGRQIKQTVELPSGEKMDTQVNWETDSFYANKAKLTFDGPRANKVETEFDWDFADASNKKLKWNTEGDNEVFGKFKLTRDYEYQKNGNKYSLKRLAMTDIPSSPLPANLETEVEAEVQGDNTSFGVYFLAAGSKYGFKMNDGHVSWVF